MSARDLDAAAWPCVGHHPDTPPPAPGTKRCRRCDWRGDDLPEHARDSGHPVCAVEACFKPAQGRMGYCDMHLTRLRRHGNLVGVRPEAPAPERFARYAPVGLPREVCWEWTGCLNNKGYGTFMVSNTPTVRTFAHRYAYELAYGPIPDGLLVMHACDNPACVNPEHLSLGTHRDNMRDMAAKGRNKRPTCARGHEWTPENTRQFVNARGYVVRRCRECRRNRVGKAAA